MNNGEKMTVKTADRDDVHILLQWEGVIIKTYEG